LPALSSRASNISTYFRRDEVVEMIGETNVYAFHHVAQNHDQERHFCTRCGTTLFWYLTVLPDLIGVAGGCFADTDLGEPTMSLTHAKKFEWVTLPEAWRIVHE
jgi:hypothetical protein